MPGSDLEIFFPSLVNRPLCSQYDGERLAGVRLRLDQLVLVVGEDQVEAAAVDVEVAAQVLHAHGRAFDVPAGPPRPPGALPRRLAGLRAFPEREIAGMPLERRRLDPGAGLQVLGVAVAELAILGRLAHVEVDVSRPTRTQTPCRSRPRLIAMISPMCSVARGMWSIPSTPSASRQSR